MTTPVRIPADVDRPDRVLGPLTARQLLILGSAGVVLYLFYLATRPFLPLAVFLIVAIPVGIAATVVALGQRDGLPLDKLLLAAIRQRLAPAHRVAAPEGVRPAPSWLTAEGSIQRGHRAVSQGVAPVPLELPATGIEDTSTHTGVVDLGADGLAVIAVCSTVNFSLRTPGEQEALVAAFARYLHSLTAPVQILVRAERLDLAPQIAELRARAGGLPHPALEAAARDHADYLADLAAQTDLLRRQVLLVLRENLRPSDGMTGQHGFSLAAVLQRRRRQHSDEEIEGHARQAAEQRLLRRLGEAVELLSPAGIVVTALDASAATGVLATACNPDTFLPPSAGLAAADDVVTSTTSFTDLYGSDEPTDPTQPLSPSTGGGGVRATGTDPAHSPRQHGATPHTPRNTVSAPRSQAGPWLSDEDDWDYDDELADQKPHTRPQQAIDDDSSFESR